jgi:hypothetical protein
MSEASPYEALSSTGRLTSGIRGDAAIRAYRGGLVHGPAVQTQPRARTSTYQRDLADRLAQVMSEPCLYPVAQATRDK